MSFQPRDGANPEAVAGPRAKAPGPCIMISAIPMIAASFAHEAQQAPIDGQPAD